jgi:RNA polymerase sigma-70 factor (ECF subfamily)
MSSDAAHVGDLVSRARDPRASLATQHAAFTQLVERFEQMAFTTALSASTDADQARDACQEAFLLAWRRLPRLRDPAAFGGWLKRLVRTQCARERRRRTTPNVPNEISETAPDPASLFTRYELAHVISRAVAQLPVWECQAVTRFYFLGESLRDVGRALGVRVERAGKLVYSGRLRLRRSLPNSVTELFLARRPAPAFVRRVQAGVFDEFVGEYRFATRPNHPVIIRREGDELTSYAGGQRNILASRRKDTLVATEFDGEARFKRGRHGFVSHFIYYEFGRRLGVARKVAQARPITRRLASA